MEIIVSKSYFSRSEGYLWEGIYSTWHHKDKNKVTFHSSNSSGSIQYTFSFHVNSFTQSEVVPAILPFTNENGGEDVSLSSSELETAQDHRRLATNAIFPSVVITMACLISQGLFQDNFISHL